MLAVGAVSAADILFVGPGENYTSIQSAVDVSNPFDTIIVRDGTYTENVDVNVDNLTVRSENGSANCFVNALSNTDQAFEVTVDYVNISGFTVQGAIGSWKAGIYLTNVDHCTISENTVSNNYNGISLWYSSSNNTLTGNTVSNNDWGIRLLTSSNNTLTSNFVLNNTYGIILSGKSNYNTLTCNIAHSNTYYVILLEGSSNNNITGNIVSNNGAGIWLNMCNNNLIYNNYFDNPYNAWDTRRNTWNITKTAGINILGGSWLGGNYWSDYTGSDTDGDGLGDTPYDISGGTNNDYRPLVAIAAPHIFDTGKGDYPSISGIHNGTIIPNQTITVSKLYTYACPGTGGHTEYVKLWNDNGWNVTAAWNGYTGDWHSISFDESFILYANETYNYTIRTGSYPQIIHEPSWNATGGVITCEDFVDVNGKRHEGWIPAITLY
jgi:parallel beta-helix repeat protein